MAFLIAILADAITGKELPLLTALWDGVTVPFFALGIPKVTLQPLKLGKI